MASPTKASAWPVLALAALMVVAAVALRGYVPGAHRTPREPAADNPLALFAVVGLLLAAVAIVTVAVIMRARHRTAGRAAAASRPDWLRAEVGRPTWRMALIAFAVVVAALFAAMALSRLGGGVGLNPPAYVPPGTSDSSTPKPGAAEADPRRPPEAPHPEPDLIGYFYAATGLFLLVLVAGSVVAMRRPPRAPTSTEEPDPDPRRNAPDGAESLARAAEVGLAEVADPGRDPRAAIIACYAAMERELARVPDAAPQDFDTASEVLARAVDRHALGPDSATQLVDLFDEARFSPHVMNEGHREVAVQVLQRVHAELRGAT
jgi:hypothetical protein